MAKAKASEAKAGKPGAKQAGVGKKQKGQKGRKQDQKRYFAVRVGRNPGVYTDLARYEAQIKGFSGAVSKVFTKKKAARLFVSEGSKTEKADASARPAAAAPIGGLSAANTAIKYDRAALPRNFVLGVSGDSRSPAPATNLPLFGVTHPGPPPGVLTELPHHRLLRLAETAAADARAAAGRASRASDEEASPSKGEAGEADEKRPSAAPLELPEDSDDDVSEGEDRGEAEDGVDDADDSDVDPLADLDDDFIELGRNRPAAASSDDDADAADGSASDAGGRSPRSGAARRPAGGAEAAAAAPEAAGVKTTWEDWEHPWYDANQKISSQSLRLHNEIVGLCTLLKATQQEDNQRREAIAKVAEVVSSVFKGAELRVFGSFSTGLHLPTSDIDCVILNASVTHVPSALKTLGTRLRSMEWVEKLEVIATARVPIIKMDVMPVGLKFDISMGVQNGTVAVELVKKYLAEWPTMRPLVTILKLFLLQRSMNEVFTGGLGSYSLLISVVAFLQTHFSRTLPLAAGKREPGAPEVSLGELMIDYFRLYGRSLAFQEIGATCASGGEFYVKKERLQNAWNEHPDRLSLIDPLDSSNDVSAGTRNFVRIRLAFDHAYAMLTTPVPRNESLLSRILRLDEILMIRPPPPKLRPKDPVKPASAPRIAKTPGGRSRSSNPPSRSPEARQPPSKRQRR